MGKVVIRLLVAEDFDIIREDLCDIIPVSYTHLDVYKRQGQHHRFLRKEGMGEGKTVSPG